MEKKKICGLNDREFWVAEYDDYSLKTLIITPAYGPDGEFTNYVTDLQQVHNVELQPLAFGTPFDVIYNIMQEDFVEKHLTPQTTAAILDLIRLK